MHKCESAKMITYKCERRQCKSDCESVYKTWNSDNAKAYSCWVV